MPLYYINYIIILHVIYAIYYINYIIIMEHVFFFYKQNHSSQSQKARDDGAVWGKRERGKKNSPTDTFLPNLIPSDQASIAFTSQTAR